MKYFKNAEKNTTPQRLLFSLFILSIFLTSFFSPVIAKTTIRLATVAPEGSAWMDAMRSLNEELKEKSGGEVEIKFYANMSMGDEKDVIRKIKLGQLHAAGFTGFGLGEILPEIRILELPYMFNDDDEIDYIDRELLDDFNRRFNKKGFVLLGWADVGWIYFLSNQPVAEPKDLKDSKVWMWQGDPLAKAFFDMLDKSPVPLSVTDVLLSLQTGLIDAAYGSPLAALALQWFTQVKYISDIPFTHSTGGVLMDLRSFNKLDEEHQELLKNLFTKYLEILTERSRKENHLAYEQILSEGVEKVNSTERQRQIMRDVGQKVHKALIGELYSEELYLQLQQKLKEFRSNRQ